MKAITEIFEALSFSISFLTDDLTDLRLKMAFSFPLYFAQIEFSQTAENDELQISAFEMFFIKAVYDKAKYVFFWPSTCNTRKKVIKSDMKTFLYVCV